MIVTVCMNPAIDKTVEIDTLLPGGLNRIQRVEYDAGGKGINVSKTLHDSFGWTSIATGFLGGNTGKMIEAALQEREIVCDFVYVDGETRTNTKVFERSGTVTELNEPGTVIPKEKLEELLKKLEGYAKEDTLFVLSGSIPQGVEKDIYLEITRRVHKHGAKVLLDADGELFRKTIPASPDIIKPNLEELKEYAKLSHNMTPEEMLCITDDFLKGGISSVTVSMGKDGAMFFWKNETVTCPALKVNAHSTVGAGDAMVAALAYAWDIKADREETIRLCMAASAGAVTTIGTKPPSRKLVEALKTQVIINSES